MTALEKDILEILTEDARIPVKKIAAMLSETEEKVASLIAEMEKSEGEHESNPFGKMGKAPEDVTKTENSEKPTAETTVSEPATEEKPAEETPIEGTNADTKDEE